MFSNQGPQTKIGRAMGILLIPRRCSFSCTCQRKIFLYRAKAYLYGFVLSHDSKFLGAPFMA